DTVSGGPTGRHPWETTTSARSSPSSARATPPSPATQSLRISALEPGRTPALASPPTIRTSGAPRWKAVRTSSVSSVNGSASIITISAPIACGAQRWNSTGSRAASSHISRARMNGWISTSGSRAPIRVSAAPDSTSWPLVMTPFALAPTRHPGSRRRLRVSAILPAAPTCAALKKQAARSRGPLPSAASRAAQASAAAVPASAFEEKADAQRIASGRSTGSLIATSNPAQDLARDHEALDLAGPLADPHELGGALHALHRQVAHVADPAVDLDRLVGDPVRGLAREQLGHRGLLDEREPGILEHRSVVDEQPRRLDLGRHVGEHELHRLEVRDRLIELLALLGVSEAVLVGAARD